MKLDGPRTARTQVAVAGARAVTAEMLSDQPRRAVIRNTLFASLVFLAIAIALTGLVVLIADSIVKGWPRLNAGPAHQRDLPLPANAGLHSAIIGTLWIIGIVILLIVPIGVGAAIFLEEYAIKERRLGRLVEVNIQNLAAVPSIIYGLLGLAFVARGPLNLGFVVITGLDNADTPGPPDGDPCRPGGDPGRTLVDPRRVGGARRTKWQTVRHQVLPAAIPESRRV